MSDKALRLLRGAGQSVKNRGLAAKGSAVAYEVEKQEKGSKLKGGRASREVREASVRTVELAQMVRAGFKIEVVDNLRQSGRLTRKELEAVIAPARTLAHRRKKGGRLSQEQSERALRVAEAIARAEEVFGQENAHTWLRRPSAALNGLTPLSLLDTQPGTEAVLSLLLRIEHGIAA